MGDFDFTGFFVASLILAVIGGIIGWEIITWLADLLWDEWLREWLHELTSGGTP